MTPHPPLPPEIERQLARATRLEWWTLGWLASIVTVIYLTLGSSQAMKAAWVEDILSLIPPALFLISVRIERRPPSREFPFGLHRTGSVAFFLAAAALAVMGGFLLYDSVVTLVTREHPTVGSMTLMGREIWLGWLMIAALVYSVIPPMILGRMKKQLARPIMDKVLYTDAEMNAADWKTGLAGILGIFGVSMGFWWADAAAAAIIALDILRDGIRGTRIATAELLDGAPRELDSLKVHAIVPKLQATLAGDDSRLTVQVRETGRFVRAVIVTEGDPVLDPETARGLLGDDGWRLIGVSRGIDTLPPADPPR